MEFAYVAYRRGVEGEWETTVSNDRNNVSLATAYGKEQSSAPLLPQVPAVFGLVGSAA